MPCRAGRERNSTASAQRPRSGRAHDTDDELVIVANCAGEALRSSRTAAVLVSYAIHRRQLWLGKAGFCWSAADSQQGRGDRQARPDRVGGLGSYEIAHQERGSTPRPLTRSIGFSSFKNHGSGEAKLMLAIHFVKIS